MKFSIHLLCLFLLLSGCSDDDKQEPPSLNWEKLGLDGKTINEMQLVGSTLYVATTTGLFRKHVTSNDDFAEIGFPGENVEAIEAFGDGQILASIFDKTGAEPPARFRTADDGEVWTAANDNFGGDHPEPALDLERHPDDVNILYATGFSTVAKSVDGGQTWAPVYGSWGGFATGISVVEINPNDVSEIWAGGQGAIENGFLLRSVNETDWDTWSDLVENPTVVKEITFSSSDKEKLFVGFEGALLKTLNGGQTWQTLIHSEENRFYFGIGLSEGSDERIYAGGWLKTNAPQPLTLSISKNGGQSWSNFVFTGEAYGGILELQIKHEEDRDIVYLGLDRGGVYRVVAPLF